MKKQMKAAAVVSAAALLAIGASMTSFAATGWVEEDGVWYYYDKDGYAVEDEWKKSGNNWYWLDGEEGGAMATDKLIEDDDYTYYVDSNGVMVTNTWVKVVNEDQDDDDPAEYRYYYMQSSGKAYKASDSGSTSFKTIDGKRYAFDEDGKMLYGWVNEDDSSLATDDSDWEEATYYCGSWEDGALKTGWQKITVYDQEKDDDKDYWFNFKSNGKKRTNTEEKKINSKYYAFDERGVMVYEWYLIASAQDGSTDLTASNVASWRYFSSPEDGARYTKGWFKVVAPDVEDEDSVFLENEYGTSFAESDADDESERWYYADGDGELYVGEIKKIKGKYYGFYPDDGEHGGMMLYGLCALITEDEEIVEVVCKDMDADDLDDCMDGEGDFADGKYEVGEGQVFSLYFFGDSSDEDVDGALKTGSTSVTLDGDSYSFYFNKTGGAESKGRGVTGIDDGKYIYKYGLKMKADSDDKYKIVYASGDTNDEDAEVVEIDSAEVRKLAEAAGVNKDDDTVKYVGTFDEDYKLVNTSGTIVKNKTASKDGDDWYFYVKSEQIKMYTNNNTLSYDDEDSGDYLVTMKSDWKDVTIDNGVSADNRYNLED